ncbi:hypothetical protein BKA70DRAFT_1401368 [Coprinopsis sp. MPI-PUGE-AT-0042]|nr:hypothetical protein BKA70DRAFT_1401368 [Coprinopsis sp. MPI-PUGE-AT-0042]
MIGAIKRLLGFGSASEDRALPIPPSHLPSAANGGHNVPPGQWPPFGSPAFYPGSQGYYPAPFYQAGPYPVHHPHGPGNYYAPGGSTLGATGSSTVLNMAPSHSRPPTAEGYPTIHTHAIAPPPMATVPLASPQALPTLPANADESRFEETRDITTFPNGNLQRRVLFDQMPDRWGWNNYAWHSNGMVSGTKVEHRVCLGVITCSSYPACKRIDRPPTTRNALEKQLKKPCKSPGCNASRVQLECDAKQYFWWETIDSKLYKCWRHEGFHRHPNPPAGRLSTEQDELLDEQVKRNPAASAHQLRVGTTVPGSRPLAEVHPILANPRAARYQLSKSHARLGISNPVAVRGVVGSFEALLELQETLKRPFLIDSGFHGKAAYVSLQTPWMAKQLQASVADWATQQGGAIANRHGYVTDGDHTYFRQGVLLATCTFSIQMACWIPVLYTWIFRQTTENHQPHFRNLFQQIIRALKDEGRELAPQDLLNVVDFSAAQREAFILEYVAACITMMGSQWDRLSSGAKAAEKERFREDAEKALQGCEAHFRRSALRIEKQAFIIPPERKAEFKAFVEKVLCDIVVSEFQRLVEDLQQQFPKTKNWITWWLRPAFSKMIFPACKTMDPDVETQIPKTSNPIEGQHHLLHHGVGTDHELIPGIERLCDFCHEFELRFDAIQDGHIDPIPPRDSRTRTVRQAFDPNDGRAPDTIEALGLDQHNRSLEQLLKSPFALQSYQWSKYSCFIDHTLEILFWCFASFPNELQDEVLRSVPHESFLSTVLYHFHRRVKLLAHPAPSDTQRDQYRHEMLMAPTLVRHRVDDVWQIYDPEEGQYGGCPQTWWDRTVKDGETSVHDRAFFYHSFELAWICPNGHIRTEREDSHLTLVPPHSVVDSILKFLKKPAIDINNFFDHFIPCRHSGSPRYLPVHTLPARACTDRGCNAMQRVDSVTCMWPNILFIRSDNYGDTRGAPASPRLKMKNHLAIPGSNGDDPVSYELVGRVLHQHFNQSSGVQGHFTAELRLDGKTFTYDDNSNGGRLIPSSDSQLLVSQRSDSFFYVYHRTSEKTLTTHSAERLWEIYPNQPIPSKAYEMDDKGEGHLDLKDAGEVFLISKPLTCSTASGSDCTKDMDDPVAEQDPQSSACMKCDICQKRFHVRCLRQNLEAQGLSETDILSIDDELFDVAICCQECLDGGAWDARFLGLCILLKQTGWKRSYPAQIISREQEVVTLQWSPHNIYGADKGPSIPQLNISRRACYSAFKRSRIFYSGEYVGGLEWPTWLCREAYDDHSYRNPDLEAVLANSLYPISAILGGKQHHPVTDLYQASCQGVNLKAKHARERVYSSFAPRFNIPITMGDKSLAAEYIQNVRQRADGGEGTFDWDLDELILVSTPLLETVIARYYLGVEPSCDEQIFDLSQVDSPSGLLQRQLTTYELAALASADDEAQALIKTLTPLTDMIIPSGDVAAATSAPLTYTQVPPLPPRGAIQLQAMAHSQSEPRPYTFLTSNSFGLQAPPKRVKLIVNTPNISNKGHKITSSTRKRKDPPPSDEHPPKKTKQSTQKAKVPPLDKQPRRSARRSSWVDTVGGK